MDNNRVTLKRILDNLGSRHLMAILLSIVLSGAAICYIGQVLYGVTHDEVQLRGEMDVMLVLCMYESKKSTENRITYG